MSTTIAHSINRHTSYRKELTGKAPRSTALECAGVACAARREMAGH